MSKRPPWSEEKKDALRRLWADPKMTRRMIAERLGVTLDAVVGQAHRMDLPDKGNGNIGAQVRWAGHQAAPRPAAKRTRPVAKIRAAEPRAVSAEPVRRQAPIVKETGRGCLWPMWSEKGATYWEAIAANRTLECGAAKATPTDVYCLEHRRIARGDRQPVGIPGAPSHQ